MSHPEPVEADVPVHTSKDGVRSSNGSTAARMRLLWGGVFAAAMATAFGPALIDLAVHVTNAELHSHILLVPFISAYLLYIRWQELPKEYSSSPVAATLALAVGGAAWAVARTSAFQPPAVSQNDYLALVAFAFVCCVAAAGFALLGGRWMRAAAFPIFFLLFLVPLPDAIAEMLETASKFGSAEAANLFFNIAGVPFLRDGLIFQLPGIVLEVAQECSGIRSSWVLLITSLLASNLFLQTTWRRTVLVLFVIPLGLIRNGLRILVIGVLCVELGPEMIDSIVHKRGGPPFFALSLVPLFALVWWFRASERKKGRPAAAGVRASSDV